MKIICTLLICSGIGLMGSVALYSVLNPELTHTQVIIESWPLAIVGLALITLGQHLREIK